MLNIQTKHTKTKMVLGNVSTSTKNAKIGNLRAFIVVRRIAEESKS